MIVYNAGVSIMKKWSIADFMIKLGNKSISLAK